MRLSVSPRIFSRPNGSLLESSSFESDAKVRFWIWIEEIVGTWMRCLETAAALMMTLIINNVCMDS